MAHRQTDTLSPGPRNNNIAYGRQSIDEDDIQAVVDVLRSDWLTQGPRSAEFEKRFAEYCGAQYAVSVTSGTAALHLSCLAAEISQGDEVLTSPITFAASANCALYVGATPVFIDIDPDTYCIDPEQIQDYLAQRKITQNGGADTRPRAIVPVHFAGYPCDMEAIKKIADENRLLIIEDACHAHGARYVSGERVGCCNYSDMTVFSFHPLKNMTTAEGGMITTNDPELYERLMMLKTHGITKEKSRFDDNHEDYYYEMQVLGFNYRLNDLQCALGISQLAKLDRFLEKRKNIAKEYNTAFMEMEDSVILPPDSQGNHSWHLYVLQLRNGMRDQVFRHLREQGIGVQVHYIPVYLFPYYRMMGYSEGLCPQGEEYFQRAISLPMHTLLERPDRERIIGEFSKALKLCSCKSGK